MLRRFALLSCLAPLTAQDVTLQVTTLAGASSRRHVPATARFAWPEALANALTKLDRDAPVLWQARLLNADGNSAPCEVLVYPPSDEAPARAELRTIVTELPAAGELRQRLVLGAGPAAPESPYSVSRGTDRLELLLGERRVLRVDTAYDPIDRARTGKPVWHLFTFDGTTPLTKGDGGEFPHHRGVFAGWNKTKVGEHSYDFWHCRDVAQRHVGFDDRRCVLSAVRGAIANSAHWLDPVSEPVARDRRTMSCWAQTDDTQLFDLEIELSADRPIELAGDPQHAGCQIRLANEVAERKDARFLRDDRATGGKDDVWSNCAWVVASARIAEQDVHVMHMNHPENPSGAVYSTRDYGRFGVCFRATVPADRPLLLRVRIAVLAGALDAARARALFADYATPPQLQIE